MRIKRSVNARKSKRKIFRATKGYRASRNNLYKIAKQAVVKSGKYAYVGRKLKKRDMRSLWITRINAAARANDLSYSKFMHGLKKLEINLNRKVLADLALNDPNAFSELAKKVHASS